MLTSAGLTRMIGATANFQALTNQALGSAFNQIKFSTAPTLTLGSTAATGILPWALVQQVGSSNQDFATYGANGIVNFTNYATSIAAAGPTSVVKLTVGETLTANRVVGAIISAAATATIAEAGFTLTIAAGAVVQTNATTLTISGGTLDFGSAEGLLMVGPATVSTGITVTSSISGNGGLTITNAGTNTPGISLNAANNYTGGTWINGASSIAAAGGYVTVGNVSAFGNGPVTLTSGTFGNSIGANFALANQIFFNNSVVNLGNAQRLFLTGPITLTGNNQIAVSQPTFFSGVVSGAGSLNLLSGNALVMQNPNNTYTGGTNVGGAASIDGIAATVAELQVNSSDTVNGSNVTTSGPLGTGALNLTGSSTTNSAVLVNANSAIPDYVVNSITLHNAITLTNVNASIGGPAATTAGAGGDINLAGAVTVMGNTNTLTVAPNINFTISGTVQGAGALTKAGTGAVLLSGPNTLTGGVTVNAGTVIVGNNQRLGTGVLTMNGGTVQDDGLAPHRVQQHVILGAGTDTINTLSPSTPFTFTGFIGGTGSLTKGYASLTSYETTMNAVQTLTFGAGITSGTFTLTVNGAVTSTITWSATVGTNSTPNTLLGNIQAALNGLPAAIAGVFNPVVNGTATTVSITFQNIAVGANVAAVPTVSAAILSGNVTIPSITPTLGSGNLVLTGAETFTGATTVNQGTLTLNGGGQLAATIGVTVNPGASLTLDNTATNNADRINDAATLTLAGGAFNFLGAANAASTEVLSSLTVNPGNATFTTTAGAGGSAQVLVTNGTTGFTRNAGGVITFASGAGQTLGTATNEVLFSTTPVTSVSVITGAITNDAAAGTINLASYGANGIVALGAYTTFTGTATDNGKNVLITAASNTVAAGITPNAYLIRGDGITVTGSVTISPTIAEVVAVDTGNTGNNFAAATVLNLGSPEGILITANTGTATGALTINSALSAGSGLTIGGTGTLSLPAANGGISSVALDSGTVILGTAASTLGGGTITAFGGVISSGTTATAGVSISNAITLNTGPSYLTFTGSNAIALNGIISGAGSIAFNMGTAAATVTYGSQTNTYTGVTNVLEGTLNVGTGGDHAWNNVSNGAGNLLVIGGNSTAGTVVATVIDGGNNIPNASNIVVNNTGFFNATASDALGGFLLNGATATIAAAGSVDNDIVALPSALASTFTGAFTVSQAAVGALYMAINVFPGAGAAAGNELTISAAMTTGLAGAAVPKLGAGTVTFAGAANSYSGQTTVDQGTLQLGKTGANNFGGTLVVGNFGGAATVKVTNNSNQFTTAERVIVNFGGTFHVSNGGAITVLQTVSTLDLRGRLHQHRDQHPQCQ